MAEHANAALTRRGYEAFHTGDLDALKDVFAENVAWHLPGANLVSGDFVGRDRVLEHLGKLAELSDATFTADVVDLLADEDRAVAIQHSTATREGKTLDTRHVLVFEIRDGRVVDVQVFPADESRDNAFWS